MEPDSTKVLQARFDELPDDVQRAIQSADADKKIQEVGQKHRLHVDQVASLDNETRLVMLGFVDPSEFADQIGIELKVSPEEADAIAAEISSALFMPIRESMQRFMEERSLQTQLLNEGKPASAAPMTPPSGGKNLSVVMPSAASAPAAPPAMPNPPVPKPLAPAPATPTPKPDMHAADVMLNQPTVSVAPKPPPPPVPKSASAPANPASSGPSQPSVKTAAPKPAAPYKADPYREPPE